MRALVVLLAAGAARVAGADDLPEGVALSGYVQADAVPWDQGSVDEADADGRALNQTRVLIRRARLEVEVERTAWFGTLELDGNTVDGATARLVGAQVGARRTRGELEASAALGLFKIPFGAEVPAPERQRALLEPSTAANALFPGSRDAGAIAQARWRGVEVAVAVVNGAPSGDAQFRGRDPSASWDVVGRVGARGVLRYGTVLSGGVSALAGTGLHPGTPAVKDSLQWIDDNENGLVETTELQVIPGAPATPSVGFDRSAIGADVAITWCLRALGGGSAAAELVLATNLDRGLAYADPVAADRDLRELGFQVQVVQAVTRHARVAARYDQYRPDRDAREAQGAQVVPTDPRHATLAVAVEGRRGDGRLIVEYDHVQNPYGRALDGAPTTRAADRVTVRAQVSF